jgi:hypothetical protein
VGILAAGHRGARKRSSATRRLLRCTTHRNLCLIGSADHPTDALSMSPGTLRQTKPQITSVVTASSVGGTVNPSV